jgi:8-oxo-dGTP pyrophosphatase MutT (NUDIX family)
MSFNWKLKGTKKILKTPVFKVFQKEYIKPKDLTNFKAYTLDVPNWVNVIGINDVGNILLIKEYRFGTDTIEVEIPGGIIEPSEDPKNAAIRELKEETGYGIRSIKFLTVVASNPAIMNNRCYTYYAELSDKGDVNFDPNEIIETEFASPLQVKEYLNTGKITNAYVVNALLWFILRNYELFNA